jgi:hypothetical protein
MSRARRAAMPSLAEMGVTPFQDTNARRFLFVVPPLTGHVNPTVALGAELALRGHQVAWSGHPGTVAPLLEPGARLFPTEDEGFTARLDQAREAWLKLRGPAALRFLWEDFIVPLGHSMVPAVETAVEEFRPDVIVSDQQTPGGAVVARRRGLPWATSATTSAEFIRPLSGLPKVDEWVTRQLAEFQRAHGLTDPMDLRRSSGTPSGSPTTSRSWGRPWAAGPSPTSRGSGWTLRSPMCWSHWALSTDRWGSGSSGSPPRS